jgi:hypothetical protein
MSLVNESPLDPCPVAAALQEAESHHFQNPYPPDGLAVNPDNAPNFLGTADGSNAMRSSRQPSSTVTIAWRAIFSQNPVLE